MSINKAEGMASQKMKEELARESGFEDVSFATRSYRPEYASTPDIRGPYRRESNYPLRDRGGNMAASEHL